MQAIILAAGKGTRLGELTEKMPKPMILVNGKPLLAHIIEHLPASVGDVLIAVGHHADAIKDYFGSAWDGRRISYFDVPELNGTGGTLFDAKNYLDERFLVANGDDLIDASDFEKLMAEPLAMGVFEGVPNHPKYDRIESHENGTLKKFRRPTDEERAAGIRVATGAFMLDRRIFEIEPVRIANGEYGLPQAVLKLSEKFLVSVVVMPSWRTVTYPEDIEKLELHLRDLSS